MSVSAVASDASYRATLSARDPFRASDASAVLMRKEPQLMPRLYGPGHFTEDPYSQVVSPHGIPVDDLVAVLQKEIRRSRIDNAVLAAYEMFTTSADVAQHLWRRLRLIAVEDVGMGLPLGPVLIDVLHRNFNATALSGSPVPCGADRDPPPRRSGERDRASSVPLGKRHRGSRLRLRCRRRLCTLIGTRARTCFLEFFLSKRTEQQSLI